MSAYTAIKAASQTLQKLLQDEITAEFGAGAPSVSLTTPKEMKSSKGVSLWLYRIVRDEFLTNQPPLRTGPHEQRRTPLPVLLHYLVTPLMGNDSETEQQVLGKVLQVLYDHPLMRGTDLQGGLDPAMVELRVTLESLSLDEISRVWFALNSESGYQLSVSYQVQVVEIDSATPLEPIVPVIELNPQFHQIVESV